jgi:hypothetical protein
VVLQFFLRVCGVSYTHKHSKKTGKQAQKKKQNTKKKTKKTRKRNTKKTGKKHETIKIHNPGLWLVKNIINLRTYSGTCDVLVF